MTTSHPQPGLRPDRFRGRAAELARIEELIADPACRLITLVGPGGIGKTRLAAEAAARAEALFPDGVATVTLQATPSPEHLAAALADALGLTFRGHEGSLPALLAALRGRRTLLVLDNAEQLAGGAALLAELAQAAPGVKVLATTRETLNLREEWVVRVDGLDVPTGAPDEDIAAFSSVQLFVDHASRVRQVSLAHEGEAIARIARLVAGMPLAIELAASWARSLSAAAIAEELARGLALLETRLRDVPARHRSVRAAFDQSWERLSDDERRLFARLAVFRGGFDRAAASEVAGATLPLLAALVDKSLVQHGGDGRYALHELLRQYAEEHLQEAEAAAARDAHSAYYLGCLARRAGDLNGGRQHEATAAIASTVENLRAALAWACRHRHDLLRHEAINALGLYYTIHGPYGEGVEALAAIADALRGSEPPERRAALNNALLGVAWLEIRRGRLAHAAAAVDECRRLYDDGALRSPPGLATDPLLALSMLALVEGRYAEAAQHAEAALERDHDPDRAHSQLAWYMLASAALAQGHYRAAQDFAGRAAATARARGDEWFLAYCLNELGAAASLLGAYDAARDHFRQSYALRERFGDPQGMAVALSLLGRVALRQRRYDEAREVLGRSLAIYRSIGDSGGLASVQHSLAEADIATGDLEGARVRMLDALGTAAAIPFTTLVLSVLTQIAEVLLDHGGSRAAIRALVLALRHPAADRETGERALRLLARHEAAGGPAAVAADAAQEPALEALAQQLRLELLAARLERPGGAAVAEAQTSGRPAPARGATTVDTLTPRERDILALIAAGHSLRAVAERLSLAQSTVRWYTTQIYAKLDVKSRTQAVARARSTGMIP